MKKNSGLFVNFFYRFTLVVAFFLAPSLFTQTLQDLVKQTNAQIWWDPNRRVALLINHSHRLTLDPRTKIALGDGKTIFELSQVTFDEKGIHLDEGSFQKLLSWFTFSSGSQLPPIVSEQQKKRVQAIVIDSGHGGLDPGSVATHVIDGKRIVLQEKKLTLKVALELEKFLKKAYPDRFIVMTRKNDTYPTLEERVRTAHAQKLKEKESIIFLSLHFNASVNKRAKGLEFWHIPQNYEREVISEKDVPTKVFPMINALVDAEFKKESREIASSLVLALGQELGQESVQRGLRENPWFVVRMTRMPAVLVELGFLTNPEEAKNLTSSEYLKKLAKGLYNGLVSFIQDYEGR